MSGFTIFILVIIAVLVCYLIVGRERWYNDPKVLLIRIGISTIAILIWFSYYINQMLLYYGKRHLPGGDLSLRFHSIQFFFFLLGFVIIYRDLSRAMKLLRLQNQCKVEAQNKS